MQPPNKCFLSKDLLSMIVPHVAYMPLGYLIRTCRWVRVNITEDQIRQCRERAKSIIGTMTALPDERFGVLFRIYDLREQAVDIGLYHLHSNMVVNGRLFIGTVTSTDGSYHDLIEILRRNAKLHRAGRQPSQALQVSLGRWSSFQENRVALQIRACLRKKIDPYYQPEHCCVEMYPLFV